MLEYNTLQQQSKEQRKQQLKDQSLFASQGAASAAKPTVIQLPETIEPKPLINSRAVQSEELAQLADYLKYSGMTGSQQVQLLNTASGALITTITAQGSSNEQQVTGSQAIRDIASSLVKASQQGLTSDQLAKLKEQYSLEEITLIPSRQAESQTLTASFVYDNKQYALATVPTTNWVSIASIDLADITAVQQAAFLAFTAPILALAIVAVLALLYITHRASAPLRYLEDTAEQAASAANLIALPRGTRETVALTQTFNGLIARVKSLLNEQTIVVEQLNLLSKITNRRTFNEQDIEQVFSEALDSARQILGVDRLVIYRFKADWSGYISHEAVTSSWTRALNKEIEDACIPTSLLDAYQKDRVVPTSDVFNAGFHPDHLKLMERLQVKANLVVPILHENHLFGLLIAHHCATTHDWRQTEISFMKQLAVQLGVMLDRVTFIQGRELQAERSQLLRDITLQLTQGDTSEAVLAQLPLVQIRQMLRVDRVIVYRFDENWKGTITAESVGADFPRALGAEIHDPCFEKDYVEKYKRGRVQATPNIYEAGLTECHLNQLKPFAVQANLVAPILQGKQLLGLLIAHQCSAPRNWKQSEVDLFSQVANQLALVLDRNNLLEQKEASAKQAEQLAEEQRQQKEALQEQLVALLQQVEEAAKGDLTVQAEVTVGEIGTVADFFNSIVESLREIVTNVKQSVLQVSQAIGEDEAAIRQLTNIALEQAEETTRTLHSVEQMTLSIQAVAEDAHQAAVVASRASSTAESGSAAMDLTVQNIQNLRSVIGDTSKKMKRLSESSQQISKVTSLIERIALQTHLLAINAGIEATRVGEEGQGFGALAEEIGELATRSANATKEVEVIVSAIQSETSQVVEAMEQSTAIVVEGTQSIQNTKQSLDQIFSVFQQIDQLVKSISEATISQTETSQIVTALMEEVVQASQQTSDSSSKVFNSLQHTVEIAQQLQTAVEPFKV
ncbi:GAF domain-containing protein [Leptolyngbya sp. FACHB-36]|nr:GAF domain-containing protein [Leptolyngbya sp. FACHB-36]